MKRRDFVFGTAAIVGSFPIVKTAFAQVPCPPTTLGAEGGTSGGAVTCGEDASAIVQVARTPEQIALSLGASSYAASAYARLEYKLASSSTWIDGHPLYRVKPGTPDDAFAGCIFDLQPGQIYDVRVTVTNNLDSVQQQAACSTRHLPGDVSQQTPDYKPSSMSALQTNINSAVPGDVIELQDGSYSITGPISVTVSGTAVNPIYIRGKSQSGTVIKSNNNRIFNVQGDHIVIENMTMDGAYPTDDTTALAIAIRLATSSPTTIDSFTLRNCIIQNFPTAVQSAGGSSGGYSHNCLVYNNTLSGTLTWSTANITTSIGWDNDGVRLVGYGNCVWNNTMDGYGDSITFAHGVDEASVDLECNYAYRNYIRNSANDTFELDHCHRFIGVYDNYCENVDTGVSQSDNTSEQNYGPTYVFRNIFVNIASRWFKPNAGWQGWHWYNNTFVRPDGHPSDSSQDSKSGFMDSSPGGNQTRFSYRNNLHVFRGTASPQALWDVTWKSYAGGMEEFDMSHNAYFPDGYNVYFRNESSNYDGITQAITGGDTHTPLYPSEAGLGNTSDRYNGAVITDANPFTNTLTLGSDVGTEVTGATTLEIASGSTAKNAGVAIPGITDGYSGTAPDIGALIEGRLAPSWGATSSNNNV